MADKSPERDVIVPARFDEETLATDLEHLPTPPAALSGLCAERSTATVACPSPA